MQTPLPIFSTAYLPPIDYMATMVKYDEVAIEVHETYPKQTYRNRCAILSANGILQLSVPVSRPYGNHTPVSDITISYSEPWNIRHWRAIESAYGSSPFFLYYRDGIEKILSCRHHSLIELNDTLTKHLLSILKSNTQIGHTASFVPYALNDDNDPRGLDYRQTFSPKKKYDQTIFKPYIQVFTPRHPFQPNLSILDLVFNLGPESLTYLKGIDTIDYLKTAASNSHVINN